MGGLNAFWQRERVKRAAVCCGSKLRTACKANPDEISTSGNLRRLACKTYLAQIGGHTPISDIVSGCLVTRSNTAKEHFEHNGRFWDVILERTQRPVLNELFRRLEDRSIRYLPLLLKLFPDPATKPRQGEVLIEDYRKGKVDEALRAFKKLYLEVVHRIVDHLETEEGR